MKIPISPRLLSCCNFICLGDRVADVGCDHGYLGIWLLTQGIAEFVIAADVREGPLQSAMRNAKKFGTANKMSFHLSDGVQNIPRDFDTLVCAGMGGETMISILESAPWLRSGQYRLVLQCQSKTPMLRAWLSEKGWRITEESVLRDGKFLYTVMEVYWEPNYPRLTATEAYFPPALMENPSEALPDYYRWVIGGLQIAISHQDDHNKAKTLAELQALAEEHPFLKEKMP